MGQDHLISVLSGVVVLVSDRGEMTNLSNAKLLNTRKTLTHSGVVNNYGHGKTHGRAINLGLPISMPMHFVPIIGP
jgi:hypothetical protein